MQLSEWIAKAPIVPYIRQADFAIRKPWFVPERKLLDYLLIYVQEGTFIATVNGLEYRFEAGDVCLIQPDWALTLEGVTDTITPFVHMDIFYNPLREQSFTTRPGQSDLDEYRHLIQPRLNDLQGIEIPVRFTPSQPVRFREKMLRLVQLCQHMDPLARLEAQNAASELVLMILKDHLKEQVQPADSKQMMNWITSYMSFRLSEPLTVSEMARRANLSPSRFTVVFREHFGMSPYQYLLHLRVRHAEELLATTTLSHQEIADYCGFSDLYHFSKSFKRCTGQPPSHYRKTSHIQK